MLRYASFVPLVNSSIGIYSAFHLRRFLSTQTNITRQYNSRVSNHDFQQLHRHRSISIALNGNPDIRPFATNPTSAKLENLDDKMKEEIRAFEAEFRKKIAKVDGLNPDEWTLIYLNRKADASLWHLWPLIIVVSIASSFMAIVTFLSVFSGVYTKQITNEEIGVFVGCGILSIAIVIILNRWRRMSAFRIYRRKPDLSKAQGKPKREYCIVWYNFWKRRRLFYYNHTETRSAQDKKRPYITPTFYARNRPWAVAVSDFINPDDYFYARMPADEEESKQGSK